VTQGGRLYAAVGAGSALGALARFGCSAVLLALLGPTFPWGTLAVNGLGSFLIGLYATVSEPGGRLTAGPARRHFVIAGFCGGFTTFSIFSLETLMLVERQAVGLAAIHVAASLAVWLISVWLGAWCGKRLNHLQQPLFNKSR
jgi:fluoride exporter